MSRSLYDKLYRLYGETLSESTISAQASALVDRDQKAWKPALSPTCLPKLDTTRVAIVGGGFAGMMAAWSLCEIYSGIEVVVFEARAEVGGRVWSNEGFTNGTRTIEFGAELVGANHPTWIKLARDLGVGLITRTGEDHYKLMRLQMKLRVDGKDLSNQDAKQMEQEMKAIILEIGKDASKIKDDNASKPWNQPDLKKFDDMSLKDKLIKPRPDGLALNPTTLGYRAIQMQLENNLVNPLDKINYLALLCLVKAGRFGTDDDGKDKEYFGYWEHTEDFRCADGCQTLVKKMVAKLTHPASKYKFTLLTNTEVKKIDTNSPSPPKFVKLEWKSTAAVKKVDAGFDYVILAVPPTVWDSIAITPQHPKDIGTIQMGPASKFFSNFKERFWILEPPTPSGIPPVPGNLDGTAPSGISSDLGMIWEGTDNQTQVGDSEVVLSAFSGGPVAKLWGDVYCKRKMRELYRGYDAYSSGKKGKKTQLVDWGTTKYIQTGYSSPQTGHMFKVAPELQKARGGGRMFLAGEHTQTDFYGFMEGALRSGRRAAVNVISTVCPGSFPDFPNA